MMLGTPKGVAWLVIVLVAVVLAPASVAASRGASEAETIATAPTCPECENAVEDLPAGPCDCGAAGLPGQRTDHGAHVHASTPAGTSAHRVSGVKVIVADNGTDDINSTGSEDREDTAAHPSTDPKVFPGPGTGLVVLAVAAAAALAYLSHRRGAPVTGATKAPLRDLEGNSNGAERF